MSKFHWHPHVEEDLLAVGRIIDDAIDTDVARIREIAQYAAQPGGKMVRPGLAMTVHRAFGGAQVPKMRKLAASVELLHTGSLIHDDISDESDTRRGRKAAHIEFGIHDSLLAGDYVMSRALALAADAEPEIVGEVLRAGASLAEGEVLQRQWLGHKRLITYSDRMRLTDLKTASLFALLVWAACMRSAFAPTHSGKAHSLGLNLGRVFQLRDDLLDVEGDSADTGKPQMLDLAQGNLTFPVIYALEHLKGRSRAELHAMVMGRAAISRERFVTLIVQGGGIDYLKDQVGRFEGLCLEAVKAFPKNAYSDSLAELVRYSANRGA